MGRLGIVSVIAIVSALALLFIFPEQTVANNQDNDSINDLRIIGADSEGFILYNEGSEEVNEVQVIIDNVLVDFELNNYLNPKKGVFVKFSENFYMGADSNMTIIPVNSSDSGNYSGSSLLYYNTLCANSNYCRKASFVNDSCEYSSLADGEHFNCYNTTGCDSNNIGSELCACLSGSCADSCGNQVCEEWENNTNCIEDCTGCSESWDNCTSPDVWFWGAIKYDNTNVCACCGDDGVLDNFENNSLICTNGNIITDRDNLKPSTFDSGAINRISGKGACESAGYSWFSSSSANYSSTNIILDSFTSAFSLFTADMDNDGDNDIIATNYISSIIWWENNNSNWVKHIIDSSYLKLVDIYVIDMDNDGDMDVLSVSESQDSMFWWENYDGKGTEWNKTVVYTLLDGASSVYSADMDNDWDNDIIATGGEGNTINWFENLDSKGHGWANHLVEDFFYDASELAAADIDNDGRNDVIAGAADSDQIAWWNGTNNTWTKNLISSEFNNIKDLEVIDLDNDGDYDVIGTSFYGNFVAWMENDNLNWTKHVITDDLFSAGELAAADMDNDGDYDVISNSFHNGEWQEHEISTGFKNSFGLAAADLDNDGDYDVIGTSYANNTLAWWENYAVNGVNGPCCGDDGVLDNFYTSDSSCANGTII